ncbi:MAG: mitochondrial ribosomal large subunit component [Chrysothrix sp. TS-e1954]|nr:MAG: mitochondrial ribosomal large subunit component [Chrysothrix sp. TS-e1954]
MDNRTTLQVNNQSSKQLWLDKTMTFPRIPVLSPPRVSRCVFCAFSRPLAPAKSTHRPRLHRQQASPFSSSSVQQNWLLPVKEARATVKGRPRIAKGGSTRGTTVIWGDYGLRLRSHDRRITATQLRVGEEVVKRRLRGTNFRFFSRFAADIAVYEKPQESRMGTGKGKFSHWACRLPVSRILFELSSNSHEQVVRDAFRLAAAKLPGLWEFVKKGDPPVMGITPLKTATTESDLRRPRKKLPLEHTAQRLPGST